MRDEYCGQLTNESSPDPLLDVVLDVVLGDESLRAIVGGDVAKLLQIQQRIGLLLAPRCQGHWGYVNIKQ